MKIAVCGKGGSGKSTISALLAKDFARRGYNVLVVDIDESNDGLHRHLGMSRPDELINYLGGKEPAAKAILEYYSTGDPKKIFDKKWGLGDIPDVYVRQRGQIRLVAIGKIAHFGEGCACTMGTLSKLFFDNLALGDKDIVIADTEAGIEHLGRGIENGFDTVLVIVDPSYESLVLCEKIKKIAGDNGTRAYFVLNKVDNSLADEMLGALDCSSVAAVIPASQGLFKASLHGKELDMSIKEIKELSEFLKINCRVE